MNTVTCDQWPVTSKPGKQIVVQIFNEEKA